MLKENLSAVLREIENGNNLGEKITLVGATKTVDVETINEAISLGLKVVAENRVQEFRQKNLLISGAEQHFIGHLQTNKVKYLVGKVELIHSVDSFHLGEAIEKECEKRNVLQNVLVEINVGGELSKSGYDLDNAVEGIKQLSTLPHLKIKGLMAMLPKSDDPSYLTKLCSKMRQLYDKLILDGYEFKYLSVGMSSDYGLTIQNGSNMIRVGSKIFGQRNKEYKDGNI